MFHLHALDVKTTRTLSYNSESVQVPLYFIYLPLSNKLVHFLKIKVWYIVVDFMKTFIKKLPQSQRDDEVEHDACIT